jgi:hypothetical protein
LWGNHAQHLSRLIFDSHLWLLSFWLSELQQFLVACGSERGLSLGSAYYEALMETLQSAQENSIYDSHEAYNPPPTPPAYNLHLIELEFQNTSLSAVIDDGHLDQDTTITQDNPRGVLTGAQSLAIQLDAIVSAINSQAAQVNPNCSSSANLPAQPFGATTSANLVPASSTPVAVEISSSGFSAPPQSVLAMAAVLWYFVTDAHGNPTSQSYNLYVGFNQTQETVTFALGHCSWSAGSANDYQQLISEINSANLQLTGSATNWISLTFDDGTSRDLSSMADSALSTSLLAIASSMDAANPGCMTGEEPPQQ